jgi:hypothetical protein
MARAASLLGGLVACLGLAACGADDAPPPKAPAAVRLQVSAPADLAVADGGTVAVRGSVNPPGARVRVLGRPAQVSGGAFSAQVPLEAGANVIDVVATARGRTAAFAALRVTREDRIRVPSLRDVAADEAESRLRDLGLDVDKTRGGGLLDHLLPGEIVVCAQDPPGGADVRRGTTVKILVARAC